MQDKLSLDAAEERAIELRRELVNGQERALWNPSLSIPAKDFYFTETGISRVKAAIET